MSYPDYPKNRLIVDEIDLTEKFGLIMSDGYTLKPPSPKVYTLDIPGGNGVIDVTEVFTGNTVYNNRDQEFVFYTVGINDFEKVKTQVSNFLHGKAFDYKLTMDPEYTYHGRFTVTEYAHSKYTIGKVGCIKISIDAEPYKTKGMQTIKVNTAGGKLIMLQNGRKPSRPVFETDESIKVICNGVETELPAGTWRINELIFQDGLNEVYIRAMNSQPTTTWNYLNPYKWAEVGEHRWFEWSNGTDSSEEITPKTWKDVKTLTWAEVSAYRWPDLMTLHARTNEEAIVYIQYEWSDL